jgi:hypothetical protein
MAKKVPESNYTYLWVTLGIILLILLFSYPRKERYVPTTEDTSADGTHILSAIIGGIDHHKEMAHPNYHFFNDSSLFPRVDLSPRLRAKYFKMCGHQIYPNATALIWVDGNVEVKSPGLVEWMTAAMGDADCAFFKHNARNTVQQELDFCVDNMSDPYLKVRYGDEPMIVQVQDYIKQGYNPRSDGLVWCGLFIRKTTPKVNQAFDHWMMENVKWSIQDQLSFPFIAWKHGLKVATIETNAKQAVFESDYHRITGHTKIQ